MSKFADTHWSVVLSAGQSTPDANAALATLCSTYRLPVLAYIRRRGYAEDAAEDLVQAFFMQFIEHAWQNKADPARGRFRSFLLTAVKRYLIDREQEAHRLKRGGAFRFESLNEADSEGIPSAATPDAAFEHDWAVAVLSHAFARLHAEARQAGKTELFEHLRPFLVERPVDADYAQVAAALNLRRNTLAVAVHRLRRRLRELVHETIADTTLDGEELGKEMNILRAAFESGTDTHHAGGAGNSEDHRSR